MKAGGERTSKRIYIIASLQSVVNRIALSFIHVLTKHHFKKVQRLRYCKRVVSVSDSIPVFGSPYRTTPMPLLTSTPFILYNKIREYKRVICSLFHVVRQKLCEQKFDVGKITTFSHLLIMISIFTVHFMVNMTLAHITDHFIKQLGKQTRSNYKTTTSS